MLDLAGGWPTATRVHLETLPCLTWLAPRGLPDAGPDVVAAKGLGEPRGGRVAVVCLFNIFNVYSSLRGRVTECKRREGDTESEAGSRLRAVSTEPDVGLKLVD